MNIQTISALAVLPFVLSIGCGPRPYRDRAVVAHEVSSVTVNESELRVVGSIIPNYSFTTYGIAVDEALALPSGDRLSIKSCGIFYMKGQVWFLKFDGVPRNTRAVRLRLRLGPKAERFEGTFDVSTDGIQWLDPGLSRW